MSASQARSDTAPHCNAVPVLPQQGVADPRMLRAAVLASVSPLVPPPASSSLGSSAAASATASAAPLPSYYTAYWQKQQQQQQPSSTYGQYPHYAYPYAQHAAPPMAAPAAAVSSEAGASAAVPHSTVSPAAAASAAASADPAAMAAYHEEYARWYQTHYAPYLAAVAQQQQQNGYQPAAASSAPSAPLPASGATVAAASGAQAVISSPSSAAAAGSLAHAHHQSGFSYSPHAPAPLQPTAAASATAVAASSVFSHSWPSSSAPPASSSSSDLAAAAKRSRWGMTEPPPPAAHAHPTLASSPAAVSPPAASQQAPAFSSSSAGSVWSPDVVEYVKRSLQWCPPNAKDAVEQWMRARLQQAVDSGDVGRIDWKAEPLAHTRMLAEQLMARDERAAMAQQARRRIEDERREWELRRQREVEREPEPLKGLRRHHRKDDAAEERKGGWSDEGEEKDSGASHRPQSLSRAQKRKRDRALRQSHLASPLLPPSRPAVWQLDSEDQSRNEHRASRFSAYVQEAAAKPLKTRIRTELFSSAGGGREEEEAIDWSSLHIVGSSTALEKSYFRLTSAPDPATVRPPAVLRQALERLLSHWAEHREYAYLCDQMKAIRQDLTVQHVHDAFTVRVYEEHARLALDVGDLSEYNQCQTQLATLYGEVQEDGARDNEAEFVMYRIAYCMITHSQSNVFSIIATLSAEQRQLPPVTAAHTQHSSRCLPALPLTLPISAVRCCADRSRAGAAQGGGRVRLLRLPARLQADSLPRRELAAAPGGQPALPGADGAGARLQADAGGAGHVQQDARLRLQAGHSALPHQLRGTAQRRREGQHTERASLITRNVYRRQHASRRTHILSSCFPLSIMSSRLGPYFASDVQYVLTASSSLHSPPVPDDDDSKQDDRHGVTHAVFSRI